MRRLRRIIKKLLKKIPGGKSILKRLPVELFSPAGESLFLLTGKETETYYRPAFDRMFILLKMFRLQGDIYEFGVMLGYTSSLFAKYLKKFRLKKMDLHLFDSFEGLPELTSEDKESYEAKQNIWLKGSMALPIGIEKKIQKKLEKKLGVGRVNVVKGFFEDTLENYFKTTPLKKAAIVHVDCDLYSSSKYVLTKLFEYNLMQDGTIVICDDWMCSLGNPTMSQKKALAETLQQFPGWQFEPYINYGLGSQVFIAHDLNIERKTVFHENTSSGSC